MSKSDFEGTQPTGGSGKKRLSVVAPVYCEEEVLPVFLSRLKQVLSGLSADLDCEVILVNDGSTDRSLEVLEKAAESDPQLKVISLSRNFGHQVAITAGMDHASGDAVVVMDADLQDPPEVILEMLSKWKEGFKVVYAVRRSRKGESLFKLGTAAAFYRFLGKLSDTPLPVDSGDFRLLDRAVVNALESIPERNRYIRGLVAWVGFSQYPLPYDRDVRYAGKTKFNLSKMLKFAIDGITSFSEKPLELATRLGALVTLAAFLGVVHLVVEKIRYPEHSLQGWTSVMVIMLFLGGIQLFCVGILGEYLGRIYREAKARPLYFVDRTMNFKDRR